MRKSKKCSDCIYFVSDSNKCRKIAEEWGIGKCNDTHADTAICGYFEGYFGYPDSGAAIKHIKRGTPVKAF